MAYLGINIAAPTTTLRTFYQSTATTFGTKAPAPAPTRTLTVSSPLPVLRTPVTFAPRPTTTVKPVTTTTVKPAPVLLPVPKPSTSVAPKPLVSMAPAPSGSIITETSDMVRSSFAKSPLPFIAIGIAALLLLNRR